jgi:hypothetical protein
MDLIEKTKMCTAIYSVLLPVCTVVMAVEAMCKDCGGDFGRDSNPYS